MKLIAFPLVGVAMLTGVVVFTVPAANKRALRSSLPIFPLDTEIGG